MLKKIDYKVVVEITQKLLTNTNKLLEYQVKINQIAVAIIIMGAFVLTFGIGQIIGRQIKLLREKKFGPNICNDINSVKIFKLIDLIENKKQFQEVKVEKVSQEILEKNIAIANDVMKHVLNLNLKYSSTLSVTTTEIQNNIEFLMKKMTACRNEQDEIINKLPENEYNLIKTSCIIATTAIKHSFTNCNEISRIGFKYLLEKTEYQGRFGVYFIKGKNGGMADHTILVIGLDSNSSASNYKKFGKNAVVCDLHSRKIFPLINIKNYLDDYHGFDKNGKAIYKTFHPFFNRIELCISNIYSNKEIKYIKNDKIKNELNDFHTLNEKQGKIQLAESIIEEIKNELKLKDVDDLDVISLRTLKLQIKKFLDPKLVIHQ